VEKPQSRKYFSQKFERKSVTRGNICLFFKSVAGSQRGGAGKKVADWASELCLPGNVSK